MKTVLHVGCGGSEIHPLFKDYKETRLDIDSRHNPDIVASMVDLGDIGTYDAIYSSHCLEHLSEDDTIKALSEFKRVLNDNGFCFILLPDLEDVKPTDDVILQAPSGDITGNDMYYGHHEFIKTNPFMVHLSQFTELKLLDSFNKAGFDNCYTKRLTDFNLLGIGIR